jgi:hypothetical protein
MGDEKAKSQGVGALVLRLEDDRYLRGRGRFMARTALAKGARSVRWRRSPTPSMTCWQSLGVEVDTLPMMPVRLLAKFALTRDKAEQAA